MADMLTATLALMRGFGGSSSYERENAIERTLAWVRANCEADGLDAEITAMVMRGVGGALIAGRVPVLPAVREGSAE